MKFACKTCFSSETDYTVGEHTHRREKKKKESILNARNISVTYNYYNWLRERKKGVEKCIAHSILRTLYKAKSEEKKLLSR